MNKFIIASALVALSLSSCNDFLDVQPEGNTTTTTYFTNDQQAIDAIDKVYADMPVEDMFGRGLFYEQAAANDIVWGRTRNFNSLALLQYTGDEEPLEKTFKSFYSQIAKCNYIIHGLMRKGINNLSQVETRTLGEAFFERGFCHFWIAYRYGTNELGVPFVRWEDYLPGEYDNSIPTQQKTVMDNYQLIVEDMDKAMTYLPKFEDYDAANQGRAHQAAALGYKAKTLAYWATWDETKWNDVITCVNDLETKYGRGLANSFEEIFGWDFANFWNKEYMWSFPSNSSSYGATFGGCKLPGVMLVDKSWPTPNDPAFEKDGYNGWGYMKPTNDIYEEFLKDGKDNARMKYSLLAYDDKFMWVGTEMGFYDHSDLQAGFMVYKYQHQYGPINCFKDGIASAEKNNGVVRINFPMMRFAEMLLFRAEANLMKGNAAAATNDINAIRKRSGLKEITGNATMQDLYHERRCELAFEYADHLFDLKRWARSNNADIKAIALAELNADPTVRFYPSIEVKDADGNVVMISTKSGDETVTTALTIAHRNDPDGAYEKRFNMEQGEEKVKYSDYMTYEEYMSQYCMYEVRGYDGYNGKPAYNNNMMTFPYPSLQVVNANGALKQLPYYE